eukprot:CAMPEP_0178404674 /NCGR_PEP_ID=MMETSP0689_2-20121128/18007_1 /TAXON_ID=160604 /ORGANISM="Amphidinium massartii, Strain CS-259" /LENGTH=400 /DNA_ID=CAMNT_0020025669 /DNA_START=114 /DNA_END=1316 /DNA_ORIENTATION=+
MDPVLDLGLNVRRYCVDRQDSDCSHDFWVPRHYGVLDVIGNGAFGVVCRAIDMDTRQDLAIKKIEDTFTHFTYAKRTLRELRVLRHLQHDNIITVRSVYFTGSVYDIEDVYVATDLMETDLGSVLRSGQHITEDHIQFFLYQILRGMKYVHSAGVVHRDLKPRNLLLNVNCDLKICDFGLAKAELTEEFLPGSAMTEYVCTRWYRAPEILCACRKYGAASDVWSIGCIFAELLCRRPLFPGRNTMDQLKLITSMLGPFSRSFFERIPDERCRRFVNSLQQVAQRQVQIDCSGSAREVLDCSLVLDPDGRLTVAQLIELDYLSAWHDPSDEPVTEPISLDEFEFERRAINLHALRQEIFKEALQYHPEVQFNRRANGFGYNILDYPLLAHGEVQQSSDEES